MLFETTLESPCCMLSLFASKLLMKFDHVLEKQWLIIRDDSLYASNLMMFVAVANLFFLWSDQKD